MKKYIFCFLFSVFCLLPARAQLTLERDSAGVLDREIVLPDVVVTAEKKNIDSRGLGNMRINMAQLRVSPLFLGERDVVKALQFLPGVSAGREGSSQLNIRGGTNDQTLYLMDDVPVYNQNHTFGFFSIFNADAVQSADLYKGGIPSMYGDRLSGLASIALKDGDFEEHNHSFTLGLLAGTLASDGAIVKDKLSYMFAARRSFIDLLYNGIMSLANEGGGGGVMISFYDVNGKLSWKINGKNKLSWQIYAGNDDLYGLNNEKKDYTDDKYSEKFGFGWKTLTSSLRFTSELTPDLRLSSNVYFTRLNNFNYFKNNEQREGVKSVSENQSLSLLNESGARTYIEQRLNEQNMLTYGFEASRQIYTPTYLSKMKDGAKTVFDAGRLKLYTASLFAYDEHRFGTWLFGAGLRASVYNNSEKTKFVVEPRLKINKYLDGKNKLMFAYDRMHQPVHSLYEMNYSVQTDFWVPFKEDVLPNSHQFSVGWKNYFSSALNFSLEAYYKRMNNLLVIKNLENYTDFHSDYETGKGGSRGLEMMVEYAENRLSSWVSYTLSKTDRTFGGKTYPFKYDAPHDVSAFAGYMVHRKGGNRNTLSLSMQYKSGYPYYVPEIRYPSAGLPTMPDAYYSLNDVSYVDYVPDYPNVRLKNYFRADLNFTMEQKMKHGSRIWQFSILNLTARNNAYAVYREDGRYKAFVLIPFLPSLSFTRKF
ncbi:MAG: TonB-dependent receptor plug domain-containing protein [Dysgonamonadaceae bacterium]|jgi:hypothetical protein|nr:TonB-dependent receptor plug domain-containing protein [Dysgonamonadaceae bacterium]